jgi:serine/threonine-protein kinase
LEGADLGAVLERGTLPISDAVEFVLQVCEAVGEAHRAGIVHRDLKPANLFLTTNADGSACVKVLDFGVSKFTADPLKVTTEGQAIGSPLYMSPEQMQGKLTVDARSDIWSLGVILYELVAGKTPFHSENLTGLRTNVLVKPPTPLTEYLPTAPQAFEAVLLRCFDKAPEGRWPNLATFAAALVAFGPPRAVQYGARVASVQGVTVDPSRLTEGMTREQAMLRASQPAADVAALTPATATTTGATSRQLSGVPRKAGKVRVAAFAGAALAALALSGGLAVRWRTGTPTPAGAADATAATIAPPPPVASAVVSVELPQPIVPPTVTPTMAPIAERAPVAPPPHGTTLSPPAWRKGPTTPAPGPASPATGPWQGERR